MKAWREALSLGRPLRAVAPRWANRREPLDQPAGPPTEPPAVPQSRVDELVRESFERGRVEGEKALSEQLLRQRAEVTALFNGALSALRQAVPQVVRDTEQALIELAFEIARKLVGELPITAAMVEATVRDALAQVEGTAELHVRLHPADLELLQKIASPLLAEDAQGRIRFSASPDVTRGGCVVQTRFGVIDARRETKLEELKRGLLT